MQTVSRALLVLALAAALTLPRSARASAGDTYGVMPRGVATAGTLTAGADDETAAFYNPAGLALGGMNGKSRLSVGYINGLPDVYINRRLDDPNHLNKYPTRLPPDEGLISAAGLFPLGGKFKHRASLGFMVYHPQDNLVRVQMYDPHSPQWIRYGANPDRLELAAGLGVRFGDKVALGIGANILAGLTGSVDFDIDLFGKKVERRDLDFQLKTTAAPIAGFTITPTDRLRLSFVYHGAMQLSVSQPNNIGLGDLGTLVLDVNGTVQYSPHELAVGAMFEPTDHLRLMADLRYQMWNLMPFPAAQVSVDLKGDVPKSLGLDEALAFNTKDPPPPFQATLVPSIAMETTLADGVTKLRAGYSFRPTFVDDQVTPNSNYLDSDTHIIGLGATFQFMDPTEVFTNPLELDLAAQAQITQPRSVTKEDATDSTGSPDVVGNYDFGGAVFAFAATLRYDFEMADQRPETFVDTLESLNAAVTELRREPVLGVDTEANSFFVYRERTCLVQVSGANSDWVFDPITIDISPLMSILADPAVEKIFHASEFDVVSLKRDYGVMIHNLYDTSIAARATGHKKVGLAPLVEELLGFKMVKDEQRSDWGRRPLTKEQMSYAFADTRYLLSLASSLKSEVTAKGLDEEVAVDCERMTRREARPREFDPESFERHPSARKMDPVSRQILRELYLLREELAKASDKPPFRIAGDQTLGEIAVRKAATRQELEGIVGLTPRVFGRHGGALISAVQRGLEKGPLPFQRRAFTPLDPTEEERYEKLRAWRRATAEARGVDVEVIAGNATLRAIAKRNPKDVEALQAVDELDVYRRRRYGELIVGALVG